MRRTVDITGGQFGTTRMTMYYNEAGPPGTQPINFADYTTFISHKSTDISAAQEAASILHDAGLVGYLDHWDPNVSGDSPDLEDYLREVIRETPSMLTVVSPSTSLSWWVPFEVGVARETESQIATYLLISPGSPKLALPSYLRKWPILASRRALQGWAIGLANNPKSSQGMRSYRFQMSAQDYGATEINELVRNGTIEFVE